MTVLNPSRSMKLLMSSADEGQELTGYLDGRSSQCRHKVSIWEPEWRFRLRRRIVVGRRCWLLGTAGICNHKWDSDHVGVMENRRHSGVGSVLKEARADNRQCFSVWPTPNDERPTTFLFFRRGLVHQQDRYVIPHRIHTPALAALQALAIFFLHQRFFADRANQNFEKILGNHDSILRHRRCESV